MFHQSELLKHIVGLPATIRQICAEITEVSPLPFVPHLSLRHDVIVSATTLRMIYQCDVAGHYFGKRSKFAQYRPLTKQEAVITDQNLINVTSKPSANILHSLTSNPNQFFAL